MLGFGIFDDHKNTSRDDEYNSYEDEYQSKMIGGISGKPIGKGFNFTIDGKTLGYRDPRNHNASSTAARKASGGLSGASNHDHNKHSYNMTNSLYKYAYGDIEAAGKALGINNVNEKEDVDKLHEYLSQPRVTEAATVEEVPDEQSKEKKSKPEPNKPFVMSDSMASNLAYSKSRQKRPDKDGYGTRVYETYVSKYKKPGKNNLNKLLGSNSENYWSEA